jgi:hypothetical protein
MFGAAPGSPVAPETRTPDTLPCNACKADVPDLLQLLLVHLADREGQLLGGRGFRNTRSTSSSRRSGSGSSVKFLLLRAEVDLDLP